MDVLLWTLCVVFVLVGLMGTILPMLPGTPMVFLGLLLGAWADDFQKVGAITLAALGFLTALTFAIDFVATKIGVEKTGASSLAAVGALVGAIVGIFFGFVGALFFPFLGAALGEYLAKKDLIQAGRAGLGTWLGMVISIAAKMGVNFAMIGIFVAAHFF
ncbi:MAG: DUF456 family protein [Chloroherpetonaceae bacterium]|nr:DUF456 family protein [Chloroherpetonaceae bacterium]MDW8437559.1 DUF456 family protein [Chloroherpetonaceae bacterium]